MNMQGAAGRPPPAYGGGTSVGDGLCAAPRFATVQTRLSLVYHKLPGEARRIFGEYSSIFGSGPVQIYRWAARYSLGVAPAYFLKVRVK